LVIFGSGKKEHPWPRTLEGRTWSVKRVRVPDYTYMAHRIKMYILAFPGMCPVYGRYIGPKNRFEDSLKTCKDKLRSMLVIWWQLLHTKCFVYGVYTPYTVGRFFIFYYTTGVKHAPQKNSENRTSPLFPTHIPPGSKPHFNRELTSWHEWRAKRPEILPSH
jgi:hypothetical protein